MPYAAVIVSMVFVVLTVVCALQAGLGRLGKCGLPIMLLGFATCSAIAFLFAGRSFADMASLRDLARVESALVLMRVALLVGILGAGLVVVDAAAQTWRHRRTLFPSLYRNRT